MATTNGAQPLLESGRTPTAVGSGNVQAPAAVAYDGLSTAEAQRRLLRDGYNELAEETVNPCVGIQRARGRDGESVCRGRGRGRDGESL